MYTILLTLAILAAPAAEPQMEPGANIFKALRVAVLQMPLPDATPQYFTHAAAETAIRETRGLHVESLQPQFPTAGSRPDVE